MKPASTIRLLLLGGLIVVTAVFFVASNRNAGRDAATSHQDQQSSLQASSPAQDSPPKDPSAAPFDTSPQAQRREESFRAMASASPALAPAELAATPPSRGPAAPAASAERPSTTADTPLQPEEDPNEVEVPLHWTLTGESASQLQLITDRKVVWDGSASAKVAPRPAASNLSWGATVQAASAKEYRGRRIEFSAHIQTDHLAGGATLWVRADDAQGATVAFDNTITRLISGDSSWTRASVVIDIPDDAAALFYGLILLGTGTAWIDRAELEVVDPDMALTGRPITRATFTQRAPPSRLREAPENLNFEDTVFIDKTLVQ